MAILATAMAYPCGAMGDSSAGCYAKGRSFASSGYIFFDHCQPGHAYVLHDLPSNSILVRVHRSWQRVCFLVSGSDSSLTRSRVVHILASGVFFSGFIKDMWCIPRPLSPPLHRITMSHSAALEYGFPSTHSTNAVSVAVYALIMLQSPDSTLRNEVKVSLQVLFCTYAFSIVLGRLYCGMHGFFDVVVGSGLGVLLSIIQCAYGVSLDGFLYNGTLEAPLIIMLVILVLIRIHPEPADDCPCFDDSVAFAGVIIGIELGNWHFSRSAYSWNDPAPATVPYTLDVIGWPRTIARVLVGVLAILAWKEITKPLLLRILPPFFRIIERAGLSLPRRFFIRATWVSALQSCISKLKII